MFISALKRNLIDFLFFLNDQAKKFGLGSFDLFYRLVKISGKTEN